MRTKVKQTKKFSILQIDNVRLVASNPSVTPYSTYIYESPKDIMYFYYDLALEKETESGWKTIKEARVTEFGIMKYLEGHINKVLAFDVKNEGVRNYFEKRNRDGSTSVSTTEYEAICPMDIYGMFHEDCFHIKKKYRTFTDSRGLNEFELYDVNIFIGGDECHGIPIGVCFTNLEREDIINIKRFAQGFMEMANEITKKDIEKLLTSNKNDKYNEPKIVRDHLKKIYNIDDWRPIFLKISMEEYILDEYIDYITGKKEPSELKCHEWHGKCRTMEEMLKTMTPHEAYMHIVDDNRRN